MKWWYLCFILLLANACSLNSSQEATLHQATNAYIDAHNNGVVMAYVGYTHPNVVGYYESQGDSVFTEKFELFSPENGGNFIEEGNVREIETRNDEIHVHYNFDCYSYGDSEYEALVDEIGLIAISVDNGVTWFFAEEDDYRNEKIFSKDEQFIAF